MKKALITGASRGIGKATAERFLREGWEVIGTSTSGDGWEHNTLLWIRLDLSLPESIEKAVKEISAHGSIDVLVNNSGTWSDLEEQDGDTERLVVQALRETLEVNLIGTIDFTEHILPSIQSPGRIIFLGSRMGSLTDAIGTYAPSYSISKAGLSMYTRKLAPRVENKNITVAIVDPGWVRTDMGGPQASRAPEEPAQEIFELATTPVPTGKFWKEGKERSW